MICDEWYACRLTSGLTICRFISKIHFGYLRHLPGFIRLVLDDLPQFTVRHQRFTMHSTTVWGLIWLKLALSSWCKRGENVVETSFRAPEVY